MDRYEREMAHIKLRVSLLERRGDIVRLPTPAAHSNMPFSVRTGQGTVTVAKGSVIHFDRKYDCDETEVTVTGGTADAPRYVYVQYEYGKKARIVDTTCASYPMPDDQYFRVAIAEVMEEDGQVTILRVLHAGNILIPGVIAI